MAVPFHGDIATSSHNFTRRAEGFYLRIMPLGASITKGDPAAPGTNYNGYRKPLRDQLRFDGWKVNMVGSTPLGTMADNDCEAYPGLRIADITEKSKAALTIYKPSVVLINAGTNDATQNYFVDTAGERIRAMAIECFIRTPSAVVILSTLIPNGLAPDNVDKINDQIRNVAASLKYQGYHIVLAEMHDNFITIANIWDKAQTHPDLDGFRKMAAVWTHAINQAEQAGWITQPSADVAFADETHGNTCLKTFGSGNQDPRSGAQILTAGNSLIADDGPYVHKSTDSGLLFKSQDYVYGHYALAQLVNVQNVPRGFERDDLVYSEVDTKKIIMFVNNGDETFAEGVKIDVDFDCDAQGIRWGDVNNDALDDFICIGKEGTMYASINQGGNPPTFKWTGGNYRNQFPGFTRDSVRLGDIDGDGRLDYCVISGNGDMQCWRNNGLSDIPASWEVLGMVAPGRNKPDLAGIRLVDINGDGRSDWLYVDANGQVDTYTNLRGDGDGLVPYWLPANITHAGQGSDTGGPDNIIFGRIHNARADYAYITRNARTETANIHVWRNDGAGGRYQKGDGAHWGDMTGTGNDDYVWISPDGKIVIFRNLNVPPSIDLFTGGHGWNAAEVYLETGYDRKALHVGDWDGDGKADIIAVERDSGVVTVWITNYNGKTFTFTKKVIPNSGLCKQGWGLGMNDVGVFFADISGSGRVDYLCMEPNGRTTAWINDIGADLRDVGQVKFSVKQHREDHRFADVNGDGRADLLWVDKFNGDTSVWYNNGEVANRLSGSKFSWDGVPTKAYQGSARGSTQYFPNIGGVGRADIVEVNPNTAHGWVYLNSCPRGGDDSEGSVPNPGLPVYTPVDIPPSDPNDAANAAAFCDKNAAQWTPKLWDDLGMGEWLIDRSRFYSSQPGGWPVQKDAADPSFNGVPRSIGLFNVYEEDDFFNWDCTTIVGECDIQDSSFKDHCKDGWQRAYALFSMSNLARLIHNLNVVLLDGEYISGLGIGKVITTFIADQTEDLATGGAFWLTVAGGAASAAGSFIPGFSGAGTAATGAILGLAGSLAADTAPFKDPRFDSFADLSLGFQKVVNGTMAILDDFYHRLFLTPPQTGDLKYGTELAGFLQSGIFSNQDISSKTPDQTLLGQMIMAPIINEVWNSQRIFILKFESITFPFGATYDPCNNKLFNNDTLGIRFYCPKGHDDLGDFNYVLFSWDSDQYYFYNNYGFEGLDTFHLDLQKMVVSSHRLQSTTNEFMTQQPTVISDLYLKFAQDPENVPPLSEALFVNLPICDLTGLKLEFTEKELVCLRGLTPIFDDTLFFPCFQDMVLHTCEKYSLGDGKPWPYDPRLHGFDTKPKK
ncbi:hypothetical protein V490_03385 [Pseudogymnoascus sp. VKM F-3557]|nr:hypothetical protein V490_03385 [Pseudogymnoascus sp. VKM F-3557]